MRGRVLGILFILSGLFFILSSFASLTGVEVMQGIPEERISILGVFMMISGIITMLFIKDDF